MFLLNFAAIRVEKVPKIFKNLRNICFKYNFTKFKLDHGQLFFLLCSLLHVCVNYTFMPSSDIDSNNVTNATEAFEESNDYRLQRHPIINFTAKARYVSSYCTWLEVC